MSKARRAGRAAGRQMARQMTRHAHATTKKLIERHANDIGEVVDTDGGITIFLPGSGMTMTDEDLYFAIPQEAFDGLEEDDRVAVMAVGNEYVVVGVLL